MNGTEGIPNPQIDPAGQSVSGGGGGIAGQWCAFVAAVQLLTRVPLWPARTTNVATLQAAPAWFPLVGALIGISTALVVAAGCLVWPVWLSVILALAVEARLTGAFHEDAVADFCDAFGGGRTRDEILTILKDSRVGAFGALGLLLAVALRGGATVATIEGQGLAEWPAWGSAMVTSSAAGRFAIVVAMASVLPVAGRTSLANLIGGQLTARHFIVSVLGIAPPAIVFAWFMPWQFLVASILIPVALGWMLRSMQRRLGGLTGDCLGFIGYVIQVLVLLAAAAKF